MIAALLAPLPAAAQGGAVTFEFQGRAVSVPRVGTKLEVVPILGLLGAEAAYSPAAGTYGVQFKDHTIQFAPGQRSVLVDDQLEEVADAPEASPGGVAVSVAFLERVVLSPLGFHLENTPDGYRIVEGARFPDVVGVRVAAADFGTTTTLVVTLARAAKAEVRDDTPGLAVIHFAGATPQIDTSFPLRSRRVRSVTADKQDLTITLTEGVAVLSWHALEGPPRVILEVGRRPPTPTPAPLLSQRRRAMPLVVIDPGHGGDDTGAESAVGMMEKDLTLSVAEQLAKDLLARGYAVRLTRDGDQTRALTDRTALANRLDATVFVSLHANASRATSARGAETYYMSLDKASDEDAAAAARLENAAKGTSGNGNSKLDLILWDMAQAEVLNESARLALDVQRELNTLLNLPDRGVKQAPFVVLKGATMPAVLVEVGFLSNAAEAKQLADAGYQQRLAAAIAAGIEEYLRSAP
jgi:N-acetylmuramoyl-L-alanine amidase